MSFQGLYMSFQDHYMSFQALYILFKLYLCLFRLYIFFLSSPYVFLGSLYILLGTRYVFLISPYVFLGYTYVFQVLQMIFWTHYMSFQALQMTFFAIHMSFQAFHMSFQARNMSFWANHNPYVLVRLLKEGRLLKGSYIKIVIKSPFKQQYSKIHKKNLTFLFVQAAVEEWKEELVKDTESKSHYKVTKQKCELILNLTCTKKVIPVIEYGALFDAVVLMLLTKFVQN